MMKRNEFSFPSVESSLYTMAALKSALLKTTMTVGIVSVVTACGGGSGASTVSNQDTSNDRPDEVTYNGPDPSTEDVQNFKLNVWDNLVSEERCGACHSTGGQSPAFVRADDINEAYALANGLVNLEIPSESRLVTKVAGGHNCWESVASVCGDIVTGYIEGWAQSSGGISNTITLTPPEIQDVGESKNFPQDSTLFSTTVYPLVSTYCSSCHSETSEIQQQPYIGSADVDVAYEASKSRIDLATAANSRLVTRLGNEFHNCWGDCLTNANEMQAAIQAFSDGVPATAVDPDLVVSKAMGLYDGIVASSGGRVETNMIALWEFKVGEGTTAFDSSGIEPAVNLTLTGDVEWVGAWGLDFNPGGKAQALTQDSVKLYDMISATGEYSIEAWVIPGNVSQEGPARIVSYSGAEMSRNFMLGQTLYNYDFHNRSAATDADGAPAVSTPDADEVLQATLQHVVATFDPIDGRKIYVDGELIVQEEAVEGGSLNSWDSSFALVLGAEVDGSNGWDGILRMLAVHNRAMSEEDIRANFDVGVGEKYYLLFNVEEHMSVPQAYVGFEVQQFDSYGYLFNSPFFISLDGTASISDVPLSGMRIGVNGREAEVGQAFANLDLSLGGTAYEEGVGQPLSGLGTVVELEFGAAEDIFFLTFDRLGADSYSRSAPPVPATPTPVDLPEQSDIGLKHFAEINATLSEVTSVPVTNASVAQTYETLKQQLPTIEALDGFLTSHQMGITQLAVEYCNVLVNDAPLRSAYFTGFDFGQPSAASGLNDSTERDAVINPILNRLLANAVAANGNVSLSTQPDPAAVRTELDSLIDTMIGSGATTNTTVIAVCAAASGSALMLLQ
ncbi:LamG domain-containing protein [Marinibactrum halimedae]|uniref:LamG-like jellyroll fold domain-containing protein n=1 Tax=Marinibactrum halimedae TaxID=1444977 RepID=A0AA37WL36_9GAMM|nr:LamG domain-containing protein [Marinibactrum halimedae]MCD9457781.1 LamG domain-containing protein [Marinibactrum halimedae]GLS24845.1 hypothetical protein GCM10007877_05590 [Marinibactrum halimedae]